jgi:vancomycin resistance protein VanW
MAADMRSMRILVRRYVPHAVRWRIRALRRLIDDTRSRVRFAATGDSPGFDVEVCRYALPLRCYPGQEHGFAAKRSNIDLALRAIDGVLLRPGETFSFWHSVGRPTASRGYAKAAALKDGLLTEEVGGAICFVSTLVYNVALLSGMAIDERYCHSVDSYGAERYFELGRDAAVEPAYRDLRARNTLSLPLLLCAHLVGETAVAAIAAQRDPCLAVELHVAPCHAPDGAFAVTTTRQVTLHGAARTDDLGISIYQHPHV